MHTIRCVGGPFDGYEHESETVGASIRFFGSEDDGEEPYYMGTSERDDRGRYLFRYVA